MNFNILKNKYSVSIDNVLNRVYIFTVNNVSISFYVSLFSYIGLDDLYPFNYEKENYKYEEPKYVFTFIDNQNNIVDSCIFQKDVDLLQGRYPFALFSNDNDFLKCSMFSYDYV